MIKPEKLKTGDRVAAVSLSWGGAGKFSHRYEAGKRQFEEEFGVQVVESEHALRDPDWLSLNPKARAEDLMAAFSDPDIHGIISTIGGDDSIRILPYLDLDVIRKNPKVFMGYSDTTVSHAACFKAGLVSFYGPAFMAGFAENTGMFPYMVDSVRRILFSDASIGQLNPNRSGWTVERLDWSDEVLQMLADAGENTFKKDKRINIRLSSHDLVGIQRKAAQKRDPLSSIDFGFDSSVCGGRTAGVRKVRTSGRRRTAASRFGSTAGSAE